MLHVCKGFLRTRSSGLESVPGGKERTSALEHTRHCRLWEGPLSLGQPSHPKVRSNWNNRAIKTALPLCSSQREGCSEDRVLVGFVQCPSWEGAREHLRLSYFEAILHPVFSPRCQSSPWTRRRRSRRGSDKVSSREAAGVRGYLPADGTLASSLSLR